MDKGYKGRRMSDEITNLTDHELLIKHGITIDLIYKLIETNNNKLDSFIDKIDNRCENSGIRIQNIKDNTLSVSATKWIIGILFVIFISIVTTLGVNQVMISNNTIGIKTNYKMIQDNHNELTKHIEKFNDTK